MRERALAMGLVDYKICSLDGLWSGMAFAVKKTRGVAWKFKSSALCVGVMNAPRTLRDILYSD